MGNDYFDDVVSISIPGERITGNDRQSLIEDAGKLKKLRAFIFRDADNRVLEAVGRHLQHLRQLYVPGEKVDDAGLVHLRTLSQVQTLGLFDTSVTGTGLIALALKQAIPSCAICL